MHLLSDRYNLLEKRTLASQRVTRRMAQKQLPQQPQVASETASNVNIRLISFFNFSFFSLSVASGSV